MESWWCNFRKFIKWDGRLREIITFFFVVTHTQAVVAFLSRTFQLFSQWKIKSKEEGGQRKEEELFRAGVWVFCERG